MHDVWVSLFSLMMEQRMDSMLVWSCESLSIDEWFRWLSDLNIIFPTEDPRFPLSRIGFTGERLQWWSELSGKYYDAIHYVETMQRGRGDLKWLYLKEVANIEALLDSIQEPQKLETAYLSVLSYFDPTPTATAKVCNCLAALKGVSSHGRLCFSTVLARHILPVDEWPNGATQALLLGWFRSNNFSDADRTAVKRLAVLMDIRLSVQPAGFQSAKAALLADYGELIAQARRLEATRVALRVHDEKRTESILARLKMDNSRGLVDPAIPDALVDEVECIGEQEYEICLPLTGIRDHDRRIRGIQENARFLVVRVSYKSQPGFCLHLSSDYIADARHDYCCYSPGQDVAPFPSCLARLNPFTYLLTQSLRRLFTCGSTTLTSIHEHASAVVRSPAAQCLVCVSSFGGQIWRPTVCSSDACRQELSRAPLEVRLHNLLDDPPVLDFLLCCLHAAAQDTTLDLLPDCPIEKTLLTEVINSFPPTEQRHLACLDEAHPGDRPHDTSQDGAPYVDERDPPGLHALGPSGQPSSADAGSGAVSHVQLGARTGASLRSPDGPPVQRGGFSRVARPQAVEDHYRGSQEHDRYSVHEPRRRERTRYLPGR